jgi:hypothetical protein
VIVIGVAKNVEAHVNAKVAIIRMLMRKKKDKSHPNKSS